MGRHTVYLLAALLSLSLAGQARAFCFDEAGALYGINPQILRAIAKVESNFNPAAVNVNTNGSYDIGLMQVNSTWASSLGKERWAAQGDACFNTKTGAWILAMCMNKYGYTWKAIGCYNSQTPDKRDRYSRKVFDQLQKVHPLEVEQAYAPLKEQLEGVVRDKVDGWVAQSAQGKGDAFAQKKAYLPVPQEVLQEPPALASATQQSALSESLRPSGDAAVGLQ